MTIIPASINIFTETDMYRAPYLVPKPACALSTTTQCRFRPDCAKCTISGGTVELLYFPVSRTTDPNATMTTAPQTALYGTTTLTAPTVYISFQTAYALNDCGTQVGARHPGALLPLHISQLSSVWGLYGTLYSQGIDPLDPVASTPYLRAGPFNLADLNWPVPASAYMNQPKFALGREIFSVVFDDYNPVLAVPPQVRGLDEKWEGCALDWVGCCAQVSAGD